jgi:hypothetical protein
MEEKKKVVYLSEAYNNIFEISINIELEGYPMTAERFKKELFNFGNSLNIFPKKYPFCRKPWLFKRKYRCAVFRKNYIFIYRVFKTKLVIYNVIHVSRYVY